MQNIKGAIFDMDGTLLDSMPVWKRLTQNYLKQFDLHITDQDFAACEGFSQPQVADYFLARHPELPLTREQMLDGMDELITSRYETIAKPKPGVIEFLERMRRKGVKMAIATLTARRHAEKALLDRGMMQYFEFMLTIEDVGVPKYEPDICLEAARPRPCPGGVHGVRGRALRRRHRAQGRLSAVRHGGVGLRRRGSRASKRQRHLCRALVRRA